MEEGISLLGQIRRDFACKEIDIRTYSPLSLAYIGDAVFDLVIRSVVVERGNMPANALHRQTVRFVKAPAQARMIEFLLESLSEEERTVYRRGRNAKPYTTAKNADPADYYKATGYEALVGYLYLTDQTDRALELIRAGIDGVGLKI